MVEDNLHSWLANITTEFIAVRLAMLWTPVRRTSPSSALLVHASCLHRPSRSSNGCQKHLKLLMTAKLLPICPRPTKASESNKSHGQKSARPLRGRERPCSLLSPMTTHLLGAPFFGFRRDCLGLLTMLPIPEAARPLQVVFAGTAFLTSTHAT